MLQWPTLTFINLHSKAKRYEKLFSFNTKGNLEAKGDTSIHGMNTLCPTLVLDMIL
jgi:hypothetical protein